VLQSRYRSYPVLDREDKVVGTLSRYHLLRPRRKRIVLVDHNEVGQSVPGLDQAELVGIIDHHRLADVQTGYPVFMRNEPVGSTTTIVATMFQEHGLMPGEKLAGLMAAAIVSDTVMFKSPTTTPRDRRIADRLARIAGIDLEALGREVFSASSADKSASVLLKTDFKEFHLADHKLGISQITTMDSEHMLKRKDEFLQEMEKLKEEKHYDMVLLMITDVLREGTQLVFLGDKEIIRQAFGISQIEGDSVFLKGVVSRKKQMVPALALLWG
jgi:manganese-dependent inorganic pyrophosphatase